MAEEFDWDCDGLEGSDHGGLCCGRSHLYEFPYIDNYDKRPSMYDREMFVRDNMFNYHGPHKGERCTVIEAVLAGEQYEQWGTALRRCGFKKVDEFINANSGNKCHVFFLHTNKVAPYVERRRGMKKVKGK